MSAAEAIVDFLASLPGWFKVGFLSMIPIFELRGGIPIGLTLLEMNIPQTYFAAVIGNMIPIPFLFLLLGPMEKLFRKTSWGDRFITKIFEHTQKKVAKNVELYKEVGLTLFVAIPLPITGAWTGAIAAYVMGLSVRKSIGCISLGVLIAGVVVTLVVKAGLGAYLLIRGG